MLSATIDPRQLTVQLISFYWSKYEVDLLYKDLIKKNSQVQGQYKWIRVVD